MKLKSGKVVEIKELTALEEILSYQLMGKEFDDKNVIGSAMLHKSVSTVLSLVSIDGVPVDPPKDMNEVYHMLNNFSAKEWKEVMVEYDKLNAVDPGE